MESKITFGLILAGGRGHSDEAFPGRTLFSSSGYTMKMPLAPLALAELSVIQAAALAARITGLKKNRLYEYALSLKGGSE